MIENLSQEAKQVNPKIQMIALETMFAENALRFCFLLFGSIFFAISSVACFKFIQS